ncbi:MAG TPA: hypothetical protein VK731_01015, partial [Candidatus Cybelea sp.]|nr:hypothetical protein [Candidatus Cybelea sp.]
MTNLISLYIGRAHFRPLFRLFAFLTSAAVFGEVGVWAQGAPTIITQPQNQAAIPGATVTFSVAATGMTNLPIVGSGALRLWLRADAGVVTNANGLVSEWVDQSGQGNNAYQTISAEQPLLEYPTAILGEPAVRFDGQASYLQGLGSVGIPDAYTSFLVYEMDSSAPLVQLPSFVGNPSTTGGSRGYYLSYGNMAFTTWGNDYITTNAIPPDTYRIWTDRYSTDLGMVELFDDIPGSTAEFEFATSGQTAPAA